MAAAPPFTVLANSNPQFSPACLLRLVIAGGSGVALYFPLDRV